MIQKVYQLVFFILLFTNINLFSEEEKDPTPLFYWNIGGGMSLNLHSANFTNLGDIPCCSPEEYGAQTALSWGANAGLYFPFTQNWLVGFDIGIVDLSADFVSNETNIGKTQVRNSSGEIAIKDVEVEYILKPELLKTSINLGIKYRFNNGFLIGVGTRLGYFISSDFEQYEKIVTPDNVTFVPEESLVRNKYSEEIPDINPVSIAPNLWLAYPLMSIGNVTVSPEISYFFNLSNVNSNDWQVNNLNIGVSLGGIFYKSIEEKVLRDTVYLRDTFEIQDYAAKDESIKLISREVSEEKEEINSSTTAYHFTINEKYEKRINRASGLIAKVETYGIDKNGRAIEVPLVVIEEFESIEGFPLLPYVYYEKGDYLLGTSSQNIISSGETAGFIPEKLKSNIDTVLSNMVNIIAKRMRDAQLMKLKLSSFYSKDLGIRKDVAEKRASEIKKYMTNVWNISDERISLDLKDVEIDTGSKDYQDLLEEARRVEFSSSSLQMSEPVFISDIFRSSNPPLIGIDFTSGGTNKTTYLAKATQDGRVLRTYSGGVENKGTDKIEWDITKEPIPQREKNIDVALEVKDKFGNIARDSASIKIEQITVKKKREIRQDDVVFEKYTLVVFDYNSSEITKVQRNIINMIKGKIKSNSSVQIEGYADRTGTGAYNKNLAKDRCNNVLGYLKTEENKGAKFSIHPIGSSKFIYDNDTPVGRSLSRCVRIIIATPVGD